MSAILNGSSSYLSFSGSAPDYPMLFACWFKPANATHHGTLIATSNNGSGGLQSLALTARGDVGSDPVYAQAWADGSASEASRAGFTASAWYLAAALFTSDTSRRVAIAQYRGTPTWSAANEIEREITSLDRVSIGALLNGGATNYFNGNIADAAIWSDVDPNLVELIVAQMAAGLAPNKIWHSQSELFAYQPLFTAVNGPEAVGSSFTANSVTYDATDQPHTHVTRARPQDTGLSTWLPWPDSGSGAGPLPARRIATVDSGGYLQLAAADSDEWVGETEPCTPDNRYQRINTRGCGLVMRLEPASGASFTISGPAYLAADGKVDDSGSVPIGTVLGIAGGYVKVAPW